MNYHSFVFNASARSEIDTLCLLDALHIYFRATRGMGLANVYAAWQTGITRFDACLAGIGGCPHAPGASGNVTTEDLVFMLERMGVATGIDVTTLLALRQRVAGWLAGETLHGTLWQAGLPQNAAPAALREAATA